MLRHSAHVGWMLLAAACAPSAPPGVSAPPLPAVEQALHSAALPAAPQGQALTRIEDPSTICMLSGRHFGRPQVPTEVDGHTYYGCCAGCAARLAANDQARAAKDPVTGETVDKAKAILAHAGDHRVLYFASEQSFARYQPPSP